MADTSLDTAPHDASGHAAALPAPLVLTLEERASLTSGADFWMTEAIERVGVPAIMLTDGPHGLRKQVAATDHLGIAESVPATCFPPAVGLGSSWDPVLVRRVGEALGIEAAVEGVAVLLGPGVNIKRHPLCGRNFEYFSEDPILAAALGVGFVLGLQSTGVGASLKHFAANNQETDRLLVSSDVDPRPLREIYLRAFQRVVTEAQPWTVMCSYNRINGVHASQDPWLLTDLLRGEWGFEGLVVSDWGAVAQRVPALRAGLDLEMPSSGGRTDTQIVAAITDGTLDEGVLDRAVTRVLELVAKATARPPVSGPLDVDAHHRLAREAAGRSIVLLKNDNSLLPLTRSTTLAVIGAFAESPRYQGAGSSHINPTRLDTALAEIRALSQVDVTYAPGFTFDDDGSADNLRTEAVAAARRARSRWSSSACRTGRSRRGSTGSTSTCPPTSSPCSTPWWRPTRGPWWCCPTVVWSRCRSSTGSRRSWKDGCSGRAAAAVPPMCCTEWSTRPPSSPRPFPGGWRTPRRTGTSRASTGTSDTARDSSWVTAGTTSAAWMLPSRSATD